MSDTNALLEKIRAERDAWYAKQAKTTPQSAAQTAPLTQGSQGDPIEKIRAAWEQEKLRRQQATPQKIQELNTLLDTWGSGYNALITDYTSRFQGRTGGWSDSYLSDTAEALEGFNTRKKALADTTKQISDILDIYGSYMDEDAVAQLRQKMKDGSSAVSQIGKAYSGSADFYGQFSDEADYQSQAKYGQYAEKYSAMDYDALRDTRYKLDPKSEEYIWLGSYMMDKVAGGQVSGAIQNVQKELAALEAFRNEYGELQRWYNDYQAGNTVDSKAETAEKLAMHKAILERFGSYENMDTMYRAKQAELEQLEEIKAYGALSQNADYQAMSGVANTEALKNGLFDFSMDNPYYNYINDLGGVREKVKEVPGDNPYSRFDYMTEAEIANYNYLYNTQGKKAAMAYLESDTVTEALAQRVAEARYKDLEEKTGKELLFAVQAGLDQFGSGVRNLFNTEDYYIPATATQRTAALVREDLADDGAKLPEFLGGASLGQAGFDAISTVSNMAPSILASTAVGFVNPTAGSIVGSGLLGASAAGNAYTEMLNAGYSPEEARLYGVSVGVSEIVMEKLLGGISKLGGNALSKTAIKNLADVDNVLARFAKSAGGKLLSGAGSEALEEGLQTIIEPYLHYAVAHENEEITVDMQEALYSALMGFVTGGLFEAVDADTYRRETTDVAADSQTVGNEDAIAERFSIERTQNMNWSEQIDSALRGDSRLRRNDTLVTGRTDSFLVKEGVTDLYLAIPQRVVTKARSGKDVSHSIKDSKLRQLQKGIQNAPVVINDPARNALVFITDVKQGGKPVLVSFEKNAQFDGDTVHKATSIHLQMDVNSLLENLSDQATVYFKDKNKPGAAVGVTNNLRSLAANIRFTEDIVAESGGVVKDDSENGTTGPENGTTGPENGTTGPENGTTGPENGTQAEPESLGQSLTRQLMKNYGLETTPQSAAQTASGGAIATGNRVLEDPLRSAAPLTRGAESAGNDGSSLNGGTDNGTGVLHGSSQRNDGTGAGEQTGGLAGRAGQTAQRDRSAVDRIRKTNERRSLGKNLRLEKVSSFSLGVQTGTEKANLQVIPEEHWDEGLRTKAQQVYEETGKRVTYVLGSIQIAGRRGSVSNVRGVITEDGIIVQADHAKLSAEQIADHEAYHGMADVYREFGLNQRLIEKIRETFSEEEFNEVLDKYIYALRETIDVEGAQDVQERARRIGQVQEEILADAYAGINSFGMDATKFTDTVRTYLKDSYISRENTQDNGTEQPTGPPSGQKENTAESGGERYLINTEYADEVDMWNRAGRPARESFILGNTGEVLQGLGAIESDIYILGDKVKTILDEHPEITLEEIKKIPSMLEDPVLILKSRNVRRGQKANTRLVIFGSVKARNGNPVLTVLDLRPMENGFALDDLQKVTSAYTKTTDPASFVKSSDVLYADEKRTAKLLRTIGFHMPITLQQSGYIGSIFYRGPDVKLVGEKFSDVVTTGQTDRFSVDEIVYNKNNESPANFILRLKSLKKAAPNDDLAGLSKQNVSQREKEVKQQIQAVLDRTSTNHAAQMERYTETKDSDPEFAQVFYDSMMGSPYREAFEQYLALTEELEQLEKTSSPSLASQNDTAAGDFVERMSVDDPVAEEEGENPSVTSLPQDDTETARKEGGSREQARAELIEALRGLSPAQMMGDEVGKLIDQYTLREETKTGRERYKVDRRNLKKALADTLGLNEEQTRRLGKLLEGYQETVRPKQKRKPRPEPGPEVTFRAAAAKKNLRKRLFEVFHIQEGTRNKAAEYIDHFADRLLKNGRLTEEDRSTFFARMYDLGAVTVAAEEHYQRGREYLRRGRIYANDSIRAEFGDDWNDFRKRAFAAGIYLTRDKTDMGVDVWQQNLYEDVGLIDPNETSMKEVLERIVAGEEFTSEDDVLDSLERQMEWALKTFAEGAQIEIDLKKRSWQEKAREREENRKKAQIRYEANQLRDLQKDTLAQLAWLKRNRKKTPDEIKVKIDRVLGDIDVYAICAANAMNWNDKYGATWADLAAMIRQAEAEYKGQWFISEELKFIRDRIDGVKLEDIVNEEDGVIKLMDLFRAAIGLRHEIENRRKLLNDAKEREFEAVKAEVKKEIAASPEKFRYDNVSQKLQEFMNHEQLTPLNFIQWLTGWNPDSTFLEMGRMFEDGARKVRQYKVEANGMLEDFLTENQDWVRRADGQGKNGMWYTHRVKPLLDWRPGKETYGPETVIHMTPLQKVQLYLASQCEDNLRHIKCGGIMFADQTLYSKGRGRWKDAFSRQRRPIRLTPKQVQELVADMTAEEQALADVLKPYYNGYGKEHINEVSLQVLGYEKAMNSNYVPIHTYDDVFAKKTGPKGKKSAEGGVKQRIEEADAAIVLESAVEVWQRHVDRMSLYYGMTIPTRNFEGFMNWSDFAGKDQADESLLWADISHKYGPKAKKYLENLIAEMNGNKESGESWLLLDFLHSAAIGATFYLNPKIWLKQVGSWFMAAPYLGVRNIRVGKVDKKLVAKYTPDLAWRYMGYSSPEARELTENKSDIHELMKKRKWTHYAFAGGNITHMDGGIAGLLWPWAEQKVRREFPDLEVGTQAQIDAGESLFYQKVAEEFNNAVARSQSTSEDIYQSEIRKHPGMKPLTMFKSDSAQSYNAIRQKLGETLYYKRTGDKENARKTGMELGWAVLGTVANNFFAAGVNLLAAWAFQGLKGYKDEDDEFDPGKFFEDALLGMTGMIIGGEELAEVICNVLTGEKWYGIDIPGWEQLFDTVETGMDCAQKLGEFCTELWTVLDAGGDGLAWVGNNGHKLLDIAGEAAEILGSLYQFPVANIKKYLFGFFENAVPGLKQEVEDFLAAPGKTSAEGLTGQALETRLGNILEARGIELSEDGLEALAGLYEAGCSGAIPGDTPGSVTIDKVSHSLNAAQKQTWENVWGDVVNGGLAEIVALEAFKQAEPETQEKMVKALYDYASARAKAELFDEYGLESGDRKTAEAVKAGADLAEYLAWRVFTTDMSTAEKLGELAAWDMDENAKKAIVGAVHGTEMKTEKGNPSQYAKFLFALETGLSVDGYLELCAGGGEIDRYLEYAEAGLEPQDALALVKAMDALSAEDGEKVTAVQKWRAVIDTQDSVEDQLAALSAEMTPYQYNRLTVGNDYGVKPETYVQLKELLPEYDADGNSDYNQKEITAAVNEIGRKLRLTKEQKAALWQITANTRSAKNNPYSTEIGWKVVNALDKLEGEDNSSLSFGEILAKQIMASM